MPDPTAVLWREVGAESVQTMRTDFRGEKHPLPLPAPPFHRHGDHLHPADGLESASQLRTGISPQSGRGQSKRLHPLPDPTNSMARRPTVY